jgi:hypothetical protein
MKYLPIVHDFVKTENNVIILDSPIVIDSVNFFKKTMPVMIDCEKPTFINVIQRSTMKHQQYKAKEGFYIFHYADYKESDKTIEIYASLYNSLDFSTLNIHGKYRKIVINKETKEVYIIRNPDLEKLNLEFPIKIEGDGRVILRHIKNRHASGLVICRDLDIVKRLEFGDKCISGEPAIHFIDKVPYLFTFAFSNNTGYLIMINMDTYEEIEIPIGEPMSIGFHSIFVPKPNL